MKFCGSVINEIIYNLSNENNKIYHIGEDIIDPYGGAFKITRNLSTKFPERVIATPISEAAITGFATGMSLRGLIPIVEIMFGDFITLSFDQILNHLSKFHQLYNKDIKPRIIIRTPMGGYRGYGPTHSQSLEKYLAGIPGIQIIAISDIHNLERLYRGSILVEKKPVIIIENKSVYSSIYLYNQNIEGFNVRFTDELYPSAILNPNNIDKIDLTIITYGGLGKIVREIIKEKKYCIQLIIISNLNRLNINLLKEYINKSDEILLLEEGTESFGLSAEYSFRIKESFKGKVYRLCAKDYLIPNAKHLELEILPSKERIINEIESIIKNN